MTHHRDAGCYKPLYGRCHLGATFQLDRARTRLLQQPAAITNRLLDRDLVAHEWHIHHDHRMLHALTYEFAVLDHLLHRRSESRFRTRHNRFDRITYENRVNIRFVQ